MITFNCIENLIDDEKNHYGLFVVEPLEIGQGITLGNALRRTLLSDLTGFAITGARINNLKHEFAKVENIREDVLEILLNLKEIRLKQIKKDLPSFVCKGFLKVKGPIIVTAGMFNLPKNTLTILNPNQYICTIVKKGDLLIEIDIENGKGYQLSEDLKKKKVPRNFLPA